MASAEKPMTVPPMSSTRMSDGRILLFTPATSIAMAIMKVDFRLFGGAPMMLSPTGIKLGMTNRGGVRSALLNQVNVPSMGSGG